MKRRQFLKGVAVIPVVSVFLNGVKAAPPPAVEKLLSGYEDRFETTKSYEQGVTRVEGNFSFYFCQENEALRNMVYDSFHLQTPIRISHGEFKDIRGVITNMNIVASVDMPIYVECSFMQIPESIYETS